MEQKDVYVLVETRKPDSGWGGTNNVGVFLNHDVAEAYREVFIKEKFGDLPVRQVGKYVFVHEFYYLIHTIKLITEV